MNLKKLLTRSISGIVYVAIIIGCILCGINGVILLAALLATLATVEFAKICGDIDRKTIPTLILDVAGCISLCFGYYIYPLFIWFFILLARFIEELYINADNPVKNLAHSMMSQLYIGVPMGILVASAYTFGSVNIIMAMFFFIWINDTGAFLVGCMFGKHKLFERISPKKTWEGFFGGLIFNLVFSAIFCYFLSDFFGVPENIILWMGWALVATLFATWGDLVESLIKRTLHIKDSGNLIPGHGGILDRIDSLLFVAPATFLYMIIYYFYFNY